MVKKLVLYACMMMSLTGCSSKAYKYDDGEYFGEAEGHHGPIKVKVLVDKHVISDIFILEEQEIPGLKEIVYEKIPPKMKKHNTWDVDGVSGATLTSTGLKNAVKDAIEDALQEE
ncbi:FMN-binding protein [Vallitalea pronyensis]|uniref:FMN-binding protein n=1 Tax=Vallitalea pronyensis TaxID=1348613 RepID=A0A8J8MHG0_9FIRM|nr:FMN-binding protein [Vallitalea pronyensis]QUI21725.1 FMN-binding protein [Vallitalea pronyensis]